MVRDRGKKWLVMGLMILGLSGLLCATDRWAAAAEVAEFLAYEYIPFYARNPISDKGLPGMGYGFVVDTVRAAYREVGVHVDVVYQPLARSTISMASGKYLGHIGSREVLKMHLSEDEMDSVQLSRYQIYFHYFKSRFQGVAPRYSRPEDLHNYRIANIIGSPAGKRMSRLGLHVDFAPSLEHGMMKLVTDRVDFWLAVGVTARTMIETHYPEQLADFAHLEPAVFKGRVGVNFAVSHPDYARRKRQFVEGMDRIHGSGLYEKILSTYFGPDQIPEYVRMERPAAAP